MFAVPSAGQRDHLWTGVLIGSVGLGLGMAVVGNQFCGNSDSGGCTGRTGRTIGFGLMGATVGAVIDGIIGSLGKQS